MKRITWLLCTAVILIPALLFLSGCSMLLSEPEPNISVVTVGDFDFSASKGGTAEITITGTTIGGSEGLMTDYSGTLQLYYASTYGSDYEMTVGNQIAVEGDFEEVLTLTLPSVDEYEFTAELTDTYDNVTTKSFSFEFLPAIVSGVSRIDSLDDSSAPSRVNVTRSSSDAAWYSMVMNDTDADVRQCFHWGDVDDQSSTDSYTADVYVSIYDHAGNLIAGPRDNGWWADGNYASDINTIDDGIELTCDTDYVIGETLFVKVTGTAGTFGFYTYCPGY